MRFCKTIAAALIGGMALCVSANGAEPATEPATQPATQPMLSAGARAELDKMKQAYLGLASLDLTGKLSFRSNIDGKKESKDAQFTSSYQSPNKFRQEVKDDSLTGSTGQKLYLYSKSFNRYLTAEAPKGKVEPGALPAPFGEMINQQNPSLMFALSADPARTLTETLPAGEQLDDVAIEGKSYSQLRLSDPKTKACMVLLLDPATHLIRRATLDLAAMLTMRGAPDVKEAQLTIDYPSSVPGAAVKEEQFAWTPPADAKDAAKEMAAGEENDPAKALEGKAAPEFALKDLDDKAVSLKDKDLAGKVLILDFWATWCGPCREGLPHVDKVYKDLKDKGVQAFALDLRESKEKAKQFVEETKLSVPVLLDSDGKVAAAYNVGGIPQTVVIGRDGLVKKVFVGSGPGSEEQLRKAVEEAASAK